MIQVNRIYLIFNRLVTKKFLVDTSDCLMLVCILNLTLFLSIKANPMPIYHHLIHYV